jgi:hypothetical protein
MRGEDFKCFFSEDEWLDILIQIESGAIIQAISLFRYNTGFDLKQGAKAVQMIAKEELNMEILTKILKP